VSPSRAKRHERESALALPRASFVEPAPAKVNLTLEIKGRREDGYHALESLVLFADFGDALHYAPGDDFSLAVEGPFAAALGGVQKPSPMGSAPGEGIPTIDGHSPFTQTLSPQERAFTANPVSVKNDPASGGDDNLVARAVALYADRRGGPVGGAFRLVKNLPVAAGLGGGSADAAAALRLLMRHSGAAENLNALVPIASRLGADVPCCLYARAALMSGIGEHLQRLDPLPPIPAVLVNPRLPLATRDVFEALSAAPLTGHTAPPAAPQFTSHAELLGYARARRNDLEAPARRLLPVIGDVLAALAATPGAQICRLSGSGPTCFALFAETAEAEAAAALIAQRHPGWWVQPVRLS
jgi:4-diphosphocytidyl-2-C-methyl-D-erythritol kinase